MDNSTHWYLCSIKYNKQVEDKVKKVQEKHLVEALNWLEAETILHTLFGACDSLDIVDITKTKATECVKSPDHEIIYKCVIKFTDLEGKTSDELKYLSGDHLNTVIADLQFNKINIKDIKGISETKINDVYPI